MALPVRLFAGGRHGDGRQAMPWIHLADYTAAVRFLIDHEQARGPYNLIAPALTTNAEFMHGLARTLDRPYWFHPPAWLLRALLGEMSAVLLQGRPARPKRLVEQGYRFRFAELQPALEDLFHQKENPK
jgi:NAD dependent epimerase/dehydratase family enzyme